MVSTLRHDVEMLRLPAGADRAVNERPANVGDVIQIPAGDYCFGDGPLLIRITEIASPHPQYPQATWTFVKGTELRRDGKEVGDRHVLVRITALWKQENA
jgi:hypothetical protein